MIHLDFPLLRRKFRSRLSPIATRLGTVIVGLALLAIISHTPSQAAASDSPWPEISRQQKPWAYWWWMGSAVDPTNITRELTRYHNAGMGGVHIIPIYGAKGWETNYIDYLSPRWMEMLRHTVAEANRLDLGIDMTTGTGWCFGCATEDLSGRSGRHVRNIFEFLSFQIFVKPLWGSLRPRSTSSLAAVRPYFAFRRRCVHAN